MNKIFLRLALGAALLLPASAARADEVAMRVPPGSYARRLGATVLADPLGTPHTRRDAAGKVLVAIFSAPTMSQGGYQEKWSSLLADQPATRLPGEVMLVLFEDMSQAGMFQGMARDDMKKQFVKGSRPLLILDESGATFKKIGIPRNRTQILIYDKTGTLRDVEQDLGDVDATVRRIRAITRQLQAE
jgi:hypothetical protein